jgi:8-oxo-dGTP diphosphatase
LGEGDFKLSYEIGLGQSPNIEVSFDALLTPNLREVTLIFLRQGEMVMLGIGTKKLGFGFDKKDIKNEHLEVDESIANRAIREFLNETNVKVHIEDLKAVAQVDFVFPTKRNLNFRAYVFEAWNWHGKPLESVAIKPEWVSIYNLPFQRMWDDACYWVPTLLLGNKRFDAQIEYAEDHLTVKKVSFELWNSLAAIDSRGSS